MCACAVVWVPGRGVKAKERRGTEARAPRCQENVAHDDELKAQTAYEDSMQGLKDEDDSQSAHPQRCVGLGGVSGV